MQAYFNFAVKFLSLLLPCFFTPPLVNPISQQLSRLRMFLFTCKTIGSVLKIYNTDVGVQSIHATHVFFFRESLPVYGACALCGIIGCVCYFKGRGGGGVGVGGGGGAWEHSSISYIMHATFPNDTSHVWLRHLLSTPLSSTQHTRH